VVRARAGDQNAIAMIVRIREEVPQSRRAALAYDMLRKYVKEHPVVESVRLGVEAVSARANQKSTIRVARDVTRVGSTKKEYVRVVECIERSPRSVDCYTLMACVVADGRDVDEDVVCAILPTLRGTLVVCGSRPVSLEQAHRRGVKVAGEWAAEFGHDGLTIVRGDGAPLAVDAGSEIVPSDELFVRAFEEAGDTDRVIQMASSVDPNARQPVRVGYVMGLARRIQGVTRRGEPIGTLSIAAAEELGEDDGSNPEIRGTA